jgi:ABC-type glycerol-3-phosphate transport system permease component
MAGFALSKMKFKSKKFLFEINMIALMFVPAAVTIPRFLVVRNLGLIDTYWGHVLPVIAMPVMVFLAKQFSDQIPDALIEAGKIDGAGDYSIFFRLILPLLRPAVATIVIMSFQNAWNSIETSNFYMTSESMKTFAYMMTTLTSRANVVAGAGITAAAVLLMFLPNLIIFIFTQSKVIATMAHSGIK